MICCDSRGLVREGHYDLHPFTLLMRIFPAAGPFSAGNPEHFIPRIWELNFIYLSLLCKKKKKKKKKSFKPFNRSPVLFSRIKWPQLPALSWTTSSQSSTSSQQCSHLGTALCPGTICCPLPLPPGGRQSTAARL